MSSGVMRFMVCAGCMTAVLLMGSHPGTRKISVTSWEAEPDPTIQSILREPENLMMGSPQKMRLEVEGPEDYDSMITTDLNNCNKTTELVPDNVDASYWWIGYNPRASITMNVLQAFVSPIAWDWRDGLGDYGSFWAWSVIILSGMVEHRMT